MKGEVSILKILYLGYFCPEPLFATLSEADQDLSIAAHKYETQLLTQLSFQLHAGKIADIRIVSILSYITGASDRPVHGQFKGLSINYVWKDRRANLPPISALKRVKELVNNWLSETEGQERIVLTYATNIALLYPLLLGNRNVKVVTICSEIPQYRIMTGGRVKQMLKRSIARYLNDRMDGYVYFSKHMSEATNPYKKPSIVIEGLPDIRVSSDVVPPSVVRPEIILYAGYLLKENGIDILLEAIMRPECKDVELWLCGAGEMASRAKECAAQCDRIRYLGQLPNERILELEREATLLINPRKPDNLLTRYSFPSKTFEYLTSGTPAIITRLDGIPDEYYDFCYTCDVSSAETLAHDLRCVLDIPQSERFEKANEALRFIAKNKSSESQVERILMFLTDLARGE